MDTDSFLSALSDMSSPLSTPATSPSPPPELMLSMRMAHARLPYPSPPSSQKMSQSGSPVPDATETSSITDKDGPPPAKRRRIAKEDRTTQYLDLSGDNVGPSEQPQLERLLHVLRKKQKIVVVAGAGISVSAGIPDFRSSTGLFKSLKSEHNLKGSGKDLFDASVYSHDTSTSTFHSMVRSMSELTKNAKPTAFHQLLATLAKEDRLLRLYSQNVDGIDTALEPLATRVPLRKDEDGKWPRTVQLHGGLDKMVCSKCNTISDFDSELFAGSVPPLCSACEEVDEIRTTIEGKRSHGIGRLRPRMVLYNEHNPDDEAIGRVSQEDLRKRPDAIIVVGTTLKVPGVRRIVREMCKSVRDRRGGVAIWLNRDPEPVGKDLEDCWDIVVGGSSDKVAELTKLRQWNELEFKEVSDEEAALAKQKTGSVQLKSSLYRPKHHRPAPPPADGRLNDSFPPPPPMTPSRRLALDRSPSWSPMTSRRTSIHESIEGNGSFIDTIQVATPAGTPTKVKKTSPLKKNISNALKALKDETKSKAAISKKATKKTPAIKKPAKTGQNKVTKKASGVKYVKPHALSKVENIATQVRTQKINTITTSFSQSKVSNPLSGAVKGTKRKGSLNGYSPMETISPQDPRQNSTSPAKVRVAFPGLLTENVEGVAKVLATM